MPSKKFLRQDSNRYSKLGKNRRKLQKWRRPKGRDSKMRLKRKSYPKTVSIGYSSPKKSKGLINGKKAITIFNVKDLSKVSKDQVALLAKVGARKKIEIIKLAEEKKIQLINVSGGKNETK